MLYTLIHLCNIYLADMHNTTHPQRSLHWPWRTKIYYVCANTACTSLQYSIATEVSLPCQELLIDNLNSSIKKKIINGTDY